MGVLGSQLVMAVRGLRPYDHSYAPKLFAMSEAAAALPPGTVIAERYGFPWLGSYIWQYRQPTVFVSLSMPINDALAEVRRRGAQYFLVPDGLEGAPEERPVIDRLPLVASGDGWELRGLTGG
jgi:hypothetical protein